MKLTALGIYGPYPKAGGTACSCYVLEQQDTALVMDMGAGSLTKLLSYMDISKLKYIWVSHFHFDHTSDILPLHYFLESSGAKVEIICPEPVTEYARTVLDCPMINFTSVKQGDVLKRGCFTLSFLEMKHTVPTMGIRVVGEGTLAYTGDTVYNDNILPLIADADIALLDCSKPQGFCGPHMTVSVAKELAEKSTARRLITTHLNPEYNPSADLVGTRVEVATENATYIVR